MSAAEIVILVLLNAAAWAVIHMGFAWGGTQLPAAWFPPDAPIFHLRGWERGGDFYRRFFRVKQWKNILPDGAAWFRTGFPKASLRATDPVYLQRFLLETCRGEAVHWAVLMSGFLFFLWNSVPVGLAMIVYAVAANLPCIVIQRYNRARLEQLLHRRATRTSPQRTA